MSTQCDTRNTKTNFYNVFGTMHTRRNNCVDCLFCIWNHKTHRMSSHKISDSVIYEMYTQRVYCSKQMRYKHTHTHTLHTFQCGSVGNKFQIQRDEMNWNANLRRLSTLSISAGSVCFMSPSFHPIYSPMPFPVCLAFWCVCLCL